MTITTGTKEEGNQKFKNDRWRMRLTQDFESSNLFLEIKKENTHIEGLCPCQRETKEDLVSQLSLTLKL